MTATMNNGRAIRQTGATPPHDADVERVILGSILVDPERSLADCSALTPSDFYIHQNRKFFQAIQHLHSEHDEINPLTVAEALERSRQLEKDEDVPALADLMEHADPHMVKRMCGRVRELRERRDAIRKARELERMACDPSVALDDLKAEALELSRGDTGQKERFPSLSAAELDAGDFALEYLIPGMLAKGQPTIWAAPKKCLKTNIGIDLCLSLASGFKFLNEFHVSGRHQVAFISGESGRATIQETARRVARSKRQPLRNFDGVHFVFNLPSLTSAEDVRHLRHFVEQHGIEVLFIDPLYLCLDGIGDAAGNLFEVGPILRKLSELMQELGVTLILCHHTRKGQANPFECPELEDIAWAGFQEFARQWILIGRREKYDPESDGEHRLWLNCGGSAGHSSLWGVDVTEGRYDDDGGRRWEVEIVKASQARARAAEEAEERQEAVQSEKQLRKHNRRREKVLEAVRGFEGGETKTQIRAAAKMDAKTFNPIFDELIDEQLIEQVEIEKNGRPERGFIAGRIRSDSGRIIPPNPGVGRSVGFSPLKGGIPPSDRPTHQTTTGREFQESSDREEIEDPFPPPSELRGSNGLPPLPSDLPIPKEECE
ncbi:MAG: AAA family ATPase [Planctomycetaceae bacterium]|nr:AAA family ATPase [Planctomycetaceae bacterium]